MQVSLLLKQAEMITSLISSLAILKQFPFLTTEQFPPHLKTGPGTTCLCFA